MQKKKERKVKLTGNIGPVPVSASPSAVAPSPRLAPTTRSPRPRLSSGSRTASRVLSDKCPAECSALLFLFVGGKKGIGPFFTKKSDEKDAGDKTPSAFFLNVFYHDMRIGVLEIFQTNKQISLKTQNLASRLFTMKAFTKGDCFRLTIVEEQSKPAIASLPWSSVCSVSSPWIGLYVLELANGCTSPPRPPCGREADLWPLYFPFQYVN